MESRSSIAERLGVLLARCDDKEWQIAAPLITAVLDALNGVLSLRLPQPSQSEPETKSASPRTEPSPDPGHQQASSASVQPHWASFSPVVVDDHGQLYRQTPLGVLPIDRGAP